jgi:hypothetical protein
MHVLNSKVRTRLNILKCIEIVVAFPDFNVEELDPVETHHLFNNLESNFANLLKIVLEFDSLPKDVLATAVIQLKELVIVI